MSYSLLSYKLWANQRYSYYFVIIYYENKVFSIQFKLSRPGQLSKVSAVDHHIKFVSVSGETQLHVACIKNNVNKLKQLLQIPGLYFKANRNTCTGSRSFLRFIVRLSIKRNCSLKYEVQTLMVRQNLCGNRTRTGTGTMPMYRFRLSSHISCSVKCSA